MTSCQQPCLRYVRLKISSRAIIWLLFQVPIAKIGSAVPHLVSVKVICPRTPKCPACGMTSCQQPCMRYGKLKISSRAIIWFLFQVPSAKIGSPVPRLVLVQVIGPRTHKTTATDMTSYQQPCMRYGKLKISSRAIIWLLFQVPSAKIGSPVPHLVSVKVICPRTHKMTATDMTSYQQPCMRYVNLKISSRAIIWFLFQVAIAKIGSSVPHLVSVKVI